MKILTFIGGSGFIGKSFLDAFKRGVLDEFKISKINVISRKPYKLKKNKELLSKKIKLIRGNIKSIKKIPKSDIIIYGAENVDPKYYKNINLAMKNHIKSINNFIKIIRKNNNKAKILYVSSGAVNSIKKNNFNLKIYKDLYAYLKIYSEKKIQELSKDKISNSIARCYSFIGRWLPRTKHYAIGNFINDALKKKFIKVKAKNIVIRSYMHADDLVYWLTKIAINSEIKKSTIYDVGSDESIEIRKLARLIGNILKKPVKLRKLISKKVEKYVPNIKKAKNKLNLKVNYNLISSIYLTVNSLNNE